jgi:hypothetical protein
MRLVFVVHPVDVSKRERATQSAGGGAERRHELPPLQQLSDVPQLVWACAASNQQPPQALYGRLVATFALQRKPGRLFPVTQKNSQRSTLSSACSM